MNKNNRDEKLKEGIVLLGWLTFSAVLEIVMALLWIVFQTKIATFLVGVSTLLLIFWIVIFILWRHFLKH